MTTTNNEIPRGPYCYDHKWPCPYWKLKLPHTREEVQAALEEAEATGRDVAEIKLAYCQYLKKSEVDMSLLEDQVKECGINETSFTWNCRIVQGADGMFSVREVYYEDGELVSVCPAPYGNYKYGSKEELLDNMYLILKDITESEVLVELN